MLSQKSLSIIEKNKSEPRPPAQGSDLFVVVEMRRVELLSENHLPRLSTSVVFVCRFPPCNAQRQALHFGIPYFMTRPREPPGSRSPLSDAFIRAAVLPVKTAAYLIRQLPPFCKNFGLF